VLLVAVCAVAVVDHTRKHDRRVAAKRDAWFCRNRGTHCGGANAVAIEAAWNRRERAYFVAVGVLGLVVIASAAGGLRSSRSQALT
jgi:hypothetical protein